MQHNTMISYKVVILAPYQVRGRLRLVSRTQ